MLIPVLEKAKYEGKEIIGSGYAGIKFWGEKIIHVYFKSETMDNLESSVQDLHVVWLRWVSMWYNFEPFCLSNSCYGDL